MQPYEKLESEYAIFTKSRHAVSCNSGTSALHLALLSVGVGAGDEVIVPDFTMAAVAFAVSYAGAVPCFADVSLDDYGILPEDVEKMITAKTKAVIVVHTYGRLAPLQRIIDICRPRGIAVIEDACEAQGAVYDSKADVTCYSFYRNKIISGEEGGICTTNRPELDQLMRYYKNMAFGEFHDYMHRHIGFNYRMPNAQAKLIMASLAKAPKNILARKRVERAYDKALKRRGLTALPPRPAVWFYETPADVERMASIPGFMLLGGRLPFKPLSSFPMYGGGKGRPNARALSRMLVLLPVRPGMKDLGIVELLWG